MSIRLGKAFDTRVKTGVQNRLVAANFFEASEAVKVWWDSLTPDEQDQMGEVRSLAWVQDGVSMYDPAIQPPQVTGIQWVDEPVDITVTSGTFTCRAQVVPMDAAVPGVRYYSSNPLIATVSNAGLITALANGTVSIYATAVDGGYSVSKEITITNNP